MNWKLDQIKLETNQIKLKNQSKLTFSWTWFSKQKLDKNESDLIKTLYKRKHSVGPGPPGGEVWAVHALGRNH